MIDRIVKRVKAYDISGKTDNSEVFARPSHGATVRCMADHVKPLLRDNPDHIVFHIGTDDPTLNKTISSKSTMCDASISNILIRKDKHYQKAQEVNSYLKVLCKQFNIDHGKSIKPQHLNKSRIHVNDSGTSILSSNVIREILNVFQ